MAKNMMSPSHKAWNDNTRRGYDNIKWIDYTKKEKDVENGIKTKQ